MPEVFLIFEHYFGRRHWYFSLHELVIISLQELIDHVENLLLCYLVVESVEKLVHRSEVGFNLLLGVLVHAQLHLCGLAAGHEAFDLGQVAHGTIVVVGEDLVLQAGGQILSHLVAALQNLLVAITKPGTGQLVLLSILLHGTHIDVVVLVDDVELPEDTGHVADLLNVLLHHVLQLLLQAVIESKGVPSLSLESHLTHASEHGIQRKVVISRLHLILETHLFVH